jgi:hypothetical protein
MPSSRIALNTEIYKKIVINIANNPKQLKESTKIK